MKTKYIIIAIVGVIVAAAIAFGVLFLINKSAEKTPETDQDQTAQETTPPANDDENNTATTANNTIIKNDLSRITAAVLNYQANSRGTLPSSDEQLANLSASYLSELGNRPDTNQPYNFLVTPNATTDVGFYAGFTCLEDGTALVQGNKRDFALVTALATGEQFCVSS